MRITFTAFPARAGLDPESLLRLHHAQALGQPTPPDAARWGGVPTDGETVTLRLP